VTKKVYIERIEDPRGLAQPAEVSCQGGSRVNVREHSGNIQGTFREHSGINQGVFWESIQGTFREHSGNTQGAFWKSIEGTIIGENSENIQGTFTGQLIQGIFWEH
jgi:hypothetical protein